jgi:hypothetical protein
MDSITIMPTLIEKEEFDRLYSERPEKLIFQPHGAYVYVYEMYTLDMGNIIYCIEVTKTVATSPVEVKNDQLSEAYYKVI